MKSSSLKMTQLERHVEDFFEWPMIGFTFLLLILFVLPYMLELTPLQEQVVRALDIGIWILFYIEMFVKFWVSSDFVATAKRNWFLIILLLSPLLLTLRFVRLARFVSLLRLLNVQRVVEKFRTGIQTIIYNVEYILLTLVIFAVMASFIVWQVEMHQGGAITNYADALWWSIVTITTIGYGDIIPSTVAGKVVGSVVSFLGIVLFMVMVARITAVFMQEQQVSQIKAVLKEEKKIERKNEKKVAKKSKGRSKNKPRVKTRALTKKATLTTDKRIKKKTVKKTAAKTIKKKVTKK